MPHKRNPDLFELTRGRAAALEGDLAAVLQIKAKLAGGYHRDFQLLKEPLMRGLDRTEAMLAAMAEARAAARGGPGALRRGAGGRRAGDRRGDAAGGSGEPVPDRLSGGRGGAPAGRDVRAAAGLAPSSPAGGAPAVWATSGLGEAARPRAPRRAAGAGRERPQVRRGDASGWRGSEEARDDRRPAEAAPQDPRAHQHPRRAHPGGAGRGAGRRGLGGDPVLGQPGHRRASGW